MFGQQADDTKKFAYGHSQQLIRTMYEAFEHYIFGQNVYQCCGLE